MILQKILFADFIIDKNKAIKKSKSRKIRCEEFLSISPISEFSRIPLCFVDNIDSQKRISMIEADKFGPLRRLPYCLFHLLDTGLNEVGMFL